MGKRNPRRTNGWRRDQVRKWLKDQGRPCALCGKPIDYSLTTWTDPKDGKVKRHPWSFEVDEIVPVSRGGSPYDRANVQPAHRICNQRRGNDEGGKGGKGLKVRLAVTHSSAASGLLKPRGAPPPRPYKPPSAHRAFFSHGFTERDSEALL